MMSVQQNAMYYSYVEYNVNDFDRFSTTFFQKITRWAKNPIGAVIRCLEMISLKQTVFKVTVTRNAETNQGMKFNSIVENVFQSKGPIEQINDLKYSISVVEGVIADITSGILKSKSNHLIAPSLSDRNIMSGQYFRQLRRLSRYKARNKADFEGLAYVLPKQDFYYHFLLEELPILITARNFYPHIEVWTSNNQPRFVYEFLSLLQIKLNKTEKQMMSFRKMIIVWAEDRKPNRVRLELLRSSFQSNTNKVSGKTELKKLIFITREGYSRFDKEIEMSIETYLCNNFGSEAFCKVDPGSMPILQQIQLFSYASQVYGAHGGALTNILFMSPGSKVYEYGLESLLAPFYKDLAELLNLDYAFIGSGIEQKSSKIIDSRN